MFPFCYSGWLRKCSSGELGGELSAAESGLSDDQVTFGSWKPRGVWWCWTFEAAVVLPSRLSLGGAGGVSAAGLQLCGCIYDT